MLFSSSPLSYPCASCLFSLLSLSLLFFLIPFLHCCLAYHSCSNARPWRGRLEPWLSQCLPGSPGSRGSLSWRSWPLEGTPSGSTGARRTEGAGSLIHVYLCTVCPYDDETLTSVPVYIALRAGKPLVMGLEEKIPSFLRLRSAPLRFRVSRSCITIEMP